MNLLSRNSSKNERRRLIWAKTRGVCAHCGRKASSQSQTIDHFVPKSQGGTYDYRNLLPLCRECNRERGSNDIDPFKYYKYAPSYVIKDSLRYKRQLLQYDFEYIDRKGKKRRKR